MVAPPPPPPRFVRSPLPQIQVSLSSTTAMEDKESSARLSHLLWDRFFTVCHAHVVFWKRRSAGRKPVGGAQEGTAPVSQGGCPPHGAIFRHHAQLLGYTYFCQDGEVRQSVLAAHLGLIRKLGVVVAARDSSMGVLLLAQCMALAEFMIRTVHDGDQSLALSARLRRDLGRVSDVPVPAAAVTSGDTSNTAWGQRSRFLSVFEADENAGVPAMHERTGVARASSRSLCSERETWLAVLGAAAASSSEDACHLFFCTWRLLGMLPPEPLSREHTRDIEGSPTVGVARLSPGVEGMAQIRSCLLGLQASGAEWGLLSSSFATALLTVRERLPGWLGVGPKHLAEAMTAQDEMLANQLRIHGLLEAFAVYARAAVATAAQQEGGMVAAQDATEADASPSRPLVDLSIGLIQLAEECFRYYERTVEGALTALFAVGARRSLSGFAAPDESRGGDAGDDGSAVGVSACEGRDPDLAVAISMLVHCHKLSGSLGRLSLLGCDRDLVGGLHAELNLLKDETVLDKLPAWHGKACTQSTSRGSQNPSRLTPSFAAPDELGSKGRNKARDAHLRRKWEVNVNVATWSTVAFSKALATRSGRRLHAAQGGGMHDSGSMDVDQTETDSSARNVDAVVDSATKICVSARSMLNSVLLSLVTLTDALVSVGTATPSITRQGSSSRHEVAAAAAGEAWSAVAVRAAALWGELSTRPWCKWFSPLCGQAFDKLVPQSGRKGATSFLSEVGSKRRKERNASELRKTVTGSWEARGADALVRLALDRGQGAPLCARAALEEGLDQMLVMLAMPHTAGHVVGYYGGVRAGTDGNVCPGGAMVVQAIEAAVPRCSPSVGRGEAAAAEGLGSMEVEPTEIPASHADLLVARGEVSTLTSLLERSSEFSDCLPKALLVIRTTLEVEANAYSSSESPNEHRRPLTDAVARSFNSMPKGVVEELVAGAVAPRPKDGAGTHDVVVVLSLAVGYPQAVGEQQNVLQKRLLDSLLATASWWVDRRGDHSFVWGGASLGNRAKFDGREATEMGPAVDLASLSLWLASKHGMFTELVVAAMGVIRGLVRTLEGRGSLAGGMVDGMAEETREDETIGSLARCLAFMTIVLGPTVGTVEEEDDTNLDSSLVGDLVECLDDTGKTVKTSLTEMDATSDEAAVETSAPDGQQEPPLVCTFVSSHRQFVNQHWYHCYTCNLVNDKGCCRLCVRVCHSGHDVSYARLSCFFCDCGSNAAEGETPPPSLENSPASASSSGGDALSSSSPAAAATAASGSGVASGAEANAHEGVRTKCSCLKARTRRELDGVLTPPPTSDSRDTAGGLESNAGRTRRRSLTTRTPSLHRWAAGKDGSGGRSPRVAAPLTNAEAASTIGWRGSPVEMASMRAALFGARGTTGIVQELHATYSLLLAKFNAMHEAVRGVVDNSGCDGGGRINGNISENVKPGGAVSAAGNSAWDSLCDAMESAFTTQLSGLQAPVAAFLRYRPVLDHNARMPTYPILAPARLLRNGSLDVRLPADGVRAKQDRAAMTLHGVVRRNLAATSCGKIAVAEAQKVLIIDPVAALALRYAGAAAAGVSSGSGSMSGGRDSTTSTPAGAQGSRSVSSSADMPVDRSHLCVLSSMTVGFDVVGVAFNPANERHLVVWGLRQCCVVVLNSRGVALRRVQVRQEICHGFRLNLRFAPVWLSSLEGGCFTPNLYTPRSDLDGAVYA